MTTYTNDQATLIADAIAYGWFNGIDQRTGEDVRAGIGMIIAGPVMVDGVEIGTAEYRVCIPLAGVVGVISGLAESLAHAVNLAPSAGEPVGPIPDPRAFAEDSPAPPGPDEGPACWACGCTQARACPGGCSWVPGANPPLCTRCAGVPNA